MYLCKEPDNPLADPDRRGEFGGTEELLGTFFFSIGANQPARNIYQVNALCIGAQHKADLSTDCKFPAVIHVFRIGGKPQLDREFEIGGRELISFKMWASFFVGKGECLVCIGGDHYLLMRKIDIARP